MRQIVNAAILGMAVVLFVAVGISIVPMFFGNRSLVITSGSMQPTIPIGSVVIVQPIPSKNLERGDIIAFNPTPDSAIPVVHRIVKIDTRKGTPYFTTRGDANATADPTEISLPATAWRQVYMVPFVGYVIAYATSPVGVGLLIVLPFLATTFVSVRDWLKKKHPAGARVSSARTI
jgi:signal peptidase I